jgi:hypothetical protein
MKLAILVLLAVAGFSLACQQAEQPPPQQLPQELHAVATPLMEPTPSTTMVAEPVQLAKIISVESSQATELRLAPLSLKKRLPPRAEVLLIPLSGELAAVHTQVLQVSPIENPCSEALPKLYETELRPITSQVWLTAAAPFDVCVIYPAIASARSLKLEALQAAQLPPKVNPANIAAALDTNNDQQPDVLLVEYCCDKPQADRKTCDLTCSAVYVRDAKGQWRIAETQTPC